MSRRGARAGLVGLAAIAGCAHTPDLGFRADPSGTLFEARDGTKLFARHWVATGEVRGVVVIVHGLKDYSARYDATATRLAAGGYSVYAFDLRGHGRSAGPRVDPGTWTHYVDDLEQFLTRVETAEPARPVFLFGHSMGGAIATLAAERHRSPSGGKVAGLALSGPALVVHAQPVLLASLALTGATMPKFPVLDLPNENFSSEIANALRMADDPLISQPVGPARTAAGLVDGMRQIWAGVDALTMPILAMHGTADKLTAPSGSRALIAAVPATDKTLRIYPGYFHDLLHEPDGHGKLVEDDLVAWLDAHTGGAAVPAPPIYAGELDGDPRGRAQAIELAAGVAQGGDAHHFSGALAINVVRSAPIGWHLALTGRFVGDFRSLALRPLGLAVRAGGAVVGLSAGMAVVTNKELAYAAGGWAELPLGPIHLGAAAEWSRLARNAGGDAPLAGDLLWTSASLRFGGDRHYWPGARAGVGPVLVGGVGWLGDTRIYSATVGLQLYGAD